MEQVAFKGEGMILSLECFAVLFEGMRWHSLSG